MKLTTSGSEIKIWISLQTAVSRFFPAAEATIGSTYINLNSLEEVKLMSSDCETCHVQETNEESEDEIERTDLHRAKPIDLPRASYRESNSIWHEILDILGEIATIERSSFEITIDQLNKEERKIIKRIHGRFFEDGKTDVFLTRMIEVEGKDPTTPSGLIQPAERDREDDESMDKLKESYVKHMESANREKFLQEY